jgi:putative ABC transport system ATP-binding protein
MQLSHVTRAYGDEVVVYAMRDVSLAINRGDFMSIVGPSGSGKSTMLGLLGILDAPTEGEISAGGRETTQLSDDERSDLRGNFIGFVFQQFHLIPHLTAQGNVETALLYRNLKKRQRAERAQAALARVGLEHRFDHRPIQMSGGEQQRVALARAIVTEPRIVLADEPTGALDTENAANVMEILTDLVNEQSAVVLVTHDRELAALTERRVSMLDGRIIADERAEPGVSLATAASGLGAKIHD